MCKGARRASSISVSERWPLWVLNFAKNREESCDLALVASPLAAPSGVHLSTTWEAFVFGFVLGTFFWVLGWLVFGSPITKIERWIPGLSVSMLDHEGSWILAFVATPLVVHPGCVSQLHMFWCWFVLQTICEGCDSLPATVFWPLYIKNLFFFCFVYAPLECSPFLDCCEPQWVFGIFSSPPVVVLLWPLSESHLRGEPCTVPCLPTGTLSFGARFVLGHSM